MPKRIVIVVWVCLAAFVWFPKRLPATSPFTIKPAPLAYTGNFSNPDWARDANVNSVSSGTVSRHCNTECTTVIQKTQTWYGVPTGYAPTQLTVKFNASAVFVIYTAGITGYVKAHVQYSLNGGTSWDDVESPLEVTETSTGNHTYSVSSHEVQISLMRTQETSDIQVKATVTVQMPNCNGVCNNPSHATGSLSIADIRVDADCTVPTGETSTDLAWNTTLPGISAVNFQGNLVAANGTDFTGRTVKEESGGDGFDGCSNTPAELLSGGSWPVLSGNIYKEDVIGTDDPYIAYYQQYGSPPCSSTETQRMVISCLSSSDFVHYASNAVGYTVGATNFLVTRANASRQKSFP